VQYSIRTLRWLAVVSLIEGALSVVAARAPSRRPVVDTLPGSGHGRKEEGGRWKEVG